MVTDYQRQVSMCLTEFPWISDQRLLQSLRTFEKRPNLLVVCEGVEPRAVTASLRDWCARPCHVRSLPGALQLPADITGSLFLENVAGMTLSQQIALNDWLDARRGALHIVSATDRPLWPAVEAGEFLEGLYYRLNTVVLEAKPPGQRSRRAVRRA